MFIDDLDLEVLIYRKIRSTTGEYVYETLHVELVEDEETEKSKIETQEKIAGYAIVHGELGEPKSKIRAWFQKWFGNWYEIILKVIGVMTVSFALVFGVIETGSLVYEYYLSKGYQKDTSAFLVFFGLIVGMASGIAGVSFLKDEKII